MSDIRKPYLKYCIVPMCKNTTTNCNQKIFFSVPKDPSIRKTWTNAMKRDEKLNPKLSCKSSLWVCEDHFSLKDDMENYMEWQLTKDVKRVKLIPGRVPHRFECQSRNSHLSIERKGSKERKHIALVEEVLVSPGPSTSSCLTVSLDSPYNAVRNLMSDKCVQAGIKKTFRSKGTSTIFQMTSVASSPVKFSKNPSLSKACVQSATNTLYKDDSVSDIDFECPAEDSSSEDDLRLGDYKQHVLIGSFDWRIYLRKPKFVAAPVSCFKHVALSPCWDSIISNLCVEIRSPDCKSCCTTNPCRYWIASVIKVAGYMGLLQFEGFDAHSGQKWINLCTEPHVHPVGWCAENKKLLVPPKSIENKCEDWKEFLVKKIQGYHTLPSNFRFKNAEQSNNIIKKGMKLEVVDKNLISVVRSAKVSQVVGGRLQVVYLDNEMEDEGFWCHERSPLIHPVGWAQIIGHALKGQPEYAKESLQKTLYRTFEPNDATWDMFLPVSNPVRELQFKPGMKLEAIDPLNLSTICVATVTEVLRNNYLMIGIDGMMAANGADCFCYHASSPCIFPVGFCEEHGIQLTPPRGYKGEFKWAEYLKKTKSEAAPVDLFHRVIPDHGFEENMYLEAVDLMEPRLICVAYITKVVGRLLRVHFEGWEDDYDQWCDCESPDLFPVGWCDVLGYKLEPPRLDPNIEDKKKKKVGKKKKKRQKSKKYSEEEDDSFSDENVNKEKLEPRNSKRR